MPFLKYNTIFFERICDYLLSKPIFYFIETDVLHRRKQCFQLFISDKILCLKFGMVEHDDTHKPRSIDQRELPIRSRNS